MGAFEILLIFFGSITIILLSIGLPLFLSFYLPKKAARETQWKVSDKEILLKIAAQADGFISARHLAETTGLSKQEAGRRLNALANASVINVRLSSKWSRYYCLKTTIVERPSPVLSNNPFLTAEDLFILFKHSNFVLTLQSICIDTGLPVEVIRKELEVFIKEKIVVKIFDGLQNISYLLNEPYKSQDNLVLENHESLYIDLGKIYSRETKS